MEKKIIVANWKMNKNVEESLDFLKDILNKNINLKYNLVICPSFMSIYPMKKLLELSDISIGAQNCFWEDQGAFTGEISPFMLSSVGVKYVILGHSERRSYFCESNSIVNKKIVKVLENKMKVILCVGEDIQTRNNNVTNDFIINQVEECLCGVSKDNMYNIIIAYEPIWAIGTGKAISAIEADEVCLNIRKFIEKKYNHDVASNIKLLYGGSLNENNFRDFLSMKNINGALIGNASLKSENIIRIMS